MLEAAPTLNVFRDGARLTLHDDDAETARELARFDRRDAAAYPRFRAELVETAELLGPWFDRPAPGGPGVARPRDRCAPSRTASGPGAATGSPRRNCLRPPPATTSSSAFAPSTRAPRSAGTRSRTRSPARRRREPPTRCCTSTLRASLGGVGMGLRPRRHGDRHPAARRRRRRGGRRDRRRRAGRADRWSKRDARPGCCSPRAARSPRSTVLSNADPKRTLLGLVGPRLPRSRDRRRRSRRIAATAPA